jgi:hypothetical protein
VERFIRILRDRERPVLIDVFTCFPGGPAGLRDPERVYHVGEYRGRRQELARLIKERVYTVTAVLCADTPFMPRWRWWAAWNAPPSKVMIVNENCDWLWLDIFHARGLLRFMLHRLGVVGEDTLATIGRVIAFPFVFSYLVAFAVWVHLRRALRMAVRPSRS